MHALRSSKTATEGEGLNENGDKAEEPTLETNDDDSGMKPIKQWNNNNDGSDDENQPKSIVEDKQQPG